MIHKIVRAFVYGSMAVLWLAFAAPIQAQTAPTVVNFLGCQPDGSTPCFPNEAQIGGTVFIKLSGPASSLQNPRVGFGGSASGVAATISGANELSFKVPAGVTAGTYGSITIASDNLADIIFSNSITIKPAAGNPPYAQATYTPGYSQATYTPGYTQATYTPQPVNSDLQAECTKQGLTYDSSTGLCLPSNPFNANANSLAKATSVGDLIRRILDILLTLAGVIAVLFIVIGGYSYITSRGNEKQATSGRQTLTYAIVGLAAVLLAYTLVNVLTNLFTQGKLFGQ